MAANVRWRDGGVDKNHLDVANGYVPMSLKSGKILQAHKTWRCSAMHKRNPLAIARGFS